MADPASGSPAPAATYSGNPGSSTRDQVRFLLGDTGPQFLLSDGELDYLVTQNQGNAYSAAIQACYSLVAQYSRKPSSESIGGVSISWGSLKDNFAALAASLQAQQNKFGGKFRAYLTGSRRSEIDAANADPDRVGPQFRRRRGPQSYPRDAYRVSGYGLVAQDWDKIP